MVGPDASHLGTIILSEIDVLVRPGNNVELMRSITVHNKTTQK